MTTFGKTFVKGGPNIPFDLLEKHEQGGVVFFCGAGISISLGLPTFEGLTLSMLNRCLSLGCDDETDKPSVIEYLKYVDQSESYIDYLNKGQNEFLLGLLESRVKPENFTNTLNEIFSQVNYTLNDTHKGILRLSGNDGKKKLVTTNFDWGFKNNIGDFDTLYSPPAFPIPKRDWSGIVHLHGLKNDNNMNRKNIVLTGADFGRAYLEEGWARRFFVQLLKNFTVVFIGYSVSDLILQYILQSLQGNSDELKHYIFLSEKDALQVKDWVNFGIEPIPYKDHCNHQELHQTLKNWADDLDQNKERQFKKIIKENNTERDIDILLTSNDKGKEHDRKCLFWLIGHDPKVIDYLMELSKEKKIEAIAESKFKPIFDWIRAFDAYYAEAAKKLKSKSGLSILEKRPDSHLAISHHNSCREGLWAWLINFHQDNPKLLAYILEKGQYLAPSARENIKLKINHYNGQGINPTIRKAWQLILNHQNLVQYDWSDLWGLLKEIQTNGAAWEKQQWKHILDLFLSHIDYQVSFTSSHMDESKSELSLSDLIRAEIDIPVLEHGVLDKVTEIINQYPDKFYQVLFSLTARLEMIMRKFEILDRPDYIDAHASKYSLQLPSIGEHEQNRFSYRCYPWANIVRIIIVIWDKQLNSDPQGAYYNMLLWKDVFRRTGYITFQRMTFYAIAGLLRKKPSQINLEVEIGYLLENQGQWLWEPSVKHEKFQLIKAIAETSNDQHQLLKLYNAILPIAPDIVPENMECCNILGTLSEIKELPENIKIKFENLKTDINFEPRRKEKEFNVYLSPVFHAGEKSDISDWNQLSPDEIVRLLMEERNVNGFILGERLNNYYTWTIENKELDKACRCLEKLLSYDQFYEEITKTLVNLIRELDKDKSIPNSINLILSLVKKVSDKDLGSIVHSIAWWIKECGKSIAAHSEEEEIYFQIWDHIFPISASQESCIFYENGRIDYTTNSINAPSGILALSLLESRLYKRSLKDIQEIPSDIKKRLERIINGDQETDGFWCAIYHICFHINTLFSLERQWIMDNLYIFYNWNNYENKACYAWSAFNHARQINPDIISGLKDNLLLAVGEKRHIFQYNDHDSYCMDVLFYQIWVNSPNLYELSKVKGVLKEEQMLRKHIAEGISNLSIRDNVDENDLFWENKMDNIVLSAWPTEKRYLMKEDEMAGFLQLCIGLKSKFNLAFKKLHDTYFSSNFDKGRVFSMLLHSLRLDKAEHLKDESLVQSAFKLIDYIWPENQPNVINNHIAYGFENAFSIIKCILTKTNHINDPKFSSFKDWTPVTLIPDCS